MLTLLERASDSGYDSTLGNSDHPRSGPSSG